MTATTVATPISTSDKLLLAKGILIANPGIFKYIGDISFSDREELAKSRAFQITGNAAQITTSAKTTNYILLPSPLPFQITSSITQLVKTTKTIARKYILQAVIGRYYTYHRRGRFTMAA